MLIIEPQNPYVDFADLVQVRVEEPTRVSLDRMHNRLDHEATIYIEGIKINLHAGPEALQFCRDLAAVAGDACAWIEESRCVRCAIAGAYSLRLAGGRYCPDCDAEMPRENEHLDADNQMRCCEARAD